METYVETTDENGHIKIKMSEDNKDILRAFTIRAKRKRIRRLKEAAAYKVANT